MEKVNQLLRILSFRRTSRTRALHQSLEPEAQNFRSVRCRTQECGEFSLSPISWATETKSKKRYLQSPRVSATYALLQHVRLCFGGNSERNCLDLLNYNNSFKFATYFSVVLY